jgi:hypothetical protein
MFTDRYIKVPIRVYNVEEKELTGKENTVDSWMMLNPYCIESYRPSTDENGNGEPYTIVVQKSGDSTTVYLTVQEFEKMVNEFHKQLFTN